MDAPNDEERGAILFSPSLSLLLLSECDTVWPLQGQALRISARKDPGFVGPKACIILETLLKKRNIK